VLCSSLRMRHATRLLQAFTGLRYESC
jgi:hypothetical protein